MLTCLTCSMLTCLTCSSLSAKLKAAYVLNNLSVLFLMAKRIAVLYIPGFCLVKAVKLNYADLKVKTSWVTQEYAFPGQNRKHLGYFGGYVKTLICNHIVYAHSKW